MLTVAFQAAFSRPWHLARPLSIPQRRALSRTSTFRSSNANKQTTDISFSDPQRPDLFYHFVHPPTPLSTSLPAFALSFLRRTPPTPESSIVIGWLPAQTYVTDTPEPPVGKRKGAGLNDFRENPMFLPVLHESNKAALRNDMDEIWINGAMQIQQGWMHIHGIQNFWFRRTTWKLTSLVDQRNIPALGRVGDPDDIIATVLVENSKILPETYQPMPSYRICTSDGVLQLTPGLADHLRRALVRIAKIEDESVDP
ncbi:hypothetical protein K443DRAFT_99429 [Laccaria amethystina LaAM-08-1]|uniref:Uncharacterized protein n=1 Tax=Laccaria amethystina LaAM-08-1 TaxID=1095629 RepID=A0A0C9XZ26_9AGAR|nr:hypothetical protein K443DRAFT_99429 [Laccaria amethystina LaAM-08-1]